MSACLPSLFFNLLISYHYDLIEIFSYFKHRLQSEWNICMQHIDKAQEKTQPASLNWRDRPAETKAIILSTWKQLSKSYLSTWTLYNGTGRSGYTLAGCDEYKLITSLVKKNPHRKEFYVLDIGAGKFGFGRGLAKYLNNNADIPDDCTIHIIGIRGEKNPHPALRRDGKCILHELGGFQIENLISDFLAHGMNLDKQIDVIVSNWCFRHLVDPLGTFLQAYSLLRPKSGLLLMDGFFYDRGIDSPEQWENDPTINMLLLLLESNAPFLIRPYNSGRCIDQFILRRPDHQECHIPLTYNSIKPLHNCQVNSLTITLFNWHPTNNEESLLNLNIGMTNYIEGSVSGDKALYDYLNENSIISDSISYHGPLLKKPVDLSISHETHASLADTTTKVPIFTNLIVPFIPAPFKPITRPLDENSESRHHLISEMINNTSRYRPDHYIKKINKLHKEGLLDQISTDVLLKKECHREDVIDSLYLLHKAGLLDDENRNTVLLHANTNYVNHFATALEAFTREGVFNDHSMKPDTIVRLIKRVILNPERCSHFTNLDMDSSIVNMMFLDKANLLNDHYLTLILNSGNNALYVGAEELIKIAEANLFTAQTSKLIAENLYLSSELFELLKELAQLDLINDKNMMLLNDFHFLTLFNEMKKCKNKQNYKKETLLLFAAIEMKQFYMVTTSEDRKKAFVLLYDANALTDKNCEFVNNNRGNIKVAEAVITLMQYNILEDFYRIYRLERNYNQISDITICAEALINLKNNNLYSGAIIDQLSTVKTDRHCVYDAINLLTRLKLLDEKTLHIILTHNDSSLKIAQYIEQFNQYGLLTVPHRDILFSQFSNILLIKNELEKASICDEKRFIKLISTHFNDVTSILTAMMQLSKHQQLTAYYYNLIETSIHRNEGQYATSISQVMIDHPTWLDQARREPGIICHSLLTLKGHGFTITDELISMFSRCPEKSNNFIIALVTLRNNNLFNEGTLQIIARALQHSNNSVIDAANALIKLKEANLYKCNTHDILHDSILTNANLLDISWAVIRLEKEKLLDQMNRTDIQSFSKIKCKQSEPIVNLICLLFKQLIEIRSSGQYFTMYLMQPMKIYYKIQEYQKKIQEISALDTDENIVHIVNQLLSNKILTQAPSFLGFSFSDSQNTLQLKDFITKNFSTLKNT